MQTYLLKWKPFFQDSFVLNSSGNSIYRAGFQLKPLCLPIVWADGQMKYPELFIALKLISLQEEPIVQKLSPHTD